MSRQFKEPVTILDAADSTGWGTTVFVKAFQHVVLQVGTASSANLTVQFAGSASADEPTFSSAQSVANHWDYVMVYDYEDGAAVNGDDGFGVTGTDDFRTFLVNIDGLNWMNANVSARSAGSVTVKLGGYSNA